MDIVDVLRAYRGAPEVIRPMDLETDVEIYGSIENFEQCKKKLESIGACADNIYVTDALMNNVFYVEQENGVYLELAPFSVDYMDMIMLEQRLPAIRSQQREMLANQKYEMFYFSVPDSWKIYDFQHRYLTIPKEKVAQTWLDVYTEVDYGFSAWDKDVIKYVMKYAVPHGKKGDITIYRGEGTSSTPLADNFSWTTDINIALFFAAKGEGHKVWKARIKAENIAFFVNARNEKEVIAAPENIENLEDLGLYSANKDYIWEFLAPVIDNGRMYGTYIPELFKSKADTSYHGMVHTARVLVNALLIAEELGYLDDFEIELLAAEAIFHDCGRQGDNRESGHGKRSAEIAMKSDFVAERFGQDEKDILYAVIACHDIPDTNGMEYIDANIADSQKSTAKLLYKILKDADALDRYRLSNYRSEFDYHLLRLDESKKLPLVTAALLKGRVENLIIDSENME